MGTPGKTRLSLACALALIAAVAGLSYASSRSLSEARDWVVHTQEVEKVIEGLSGALFELESGVRGYVLTGQESFLKPAIEAERLLPEGVARLQRVVADNPKQALAAQELGRLLIEKIAFNEEVLAALRASGPTAGRDVIATGRGQVIMERIGRSIAVLRAEEQRLLAERHATAEALKARTNRITLALLPLLALFALVFALLVRSERRLRRSAEVAIRQSEQRFRLLLGAIKDYAIFVLDPDGRVRTWNPAAARLFGYAEAEAIGLHLSQLYEPHDALAKLPQRELADAERAGWFEARGARVKKGGQTFTADALLTPMRDEDGTLRGYANIIRDVTEQQRTERKLQAFAEKLAASNRELQDFAMIASHDLQEPLRKIQMFGDKLQRKHGAQLGEEGRDYVGRMQLAAARGQSLIQGLLAFSRVTTKAQPPVPVDLSVCAREVVSDLEARIADVGGKVELGPLPTVEADPLQMRQLLQNLIGNALKFRRPGVPPIVRVTSGPHPERPGAIRLAVADNGIGFDEKYLDRIFKLFQRLHERGTYEGSGMGLAIVRKIAERHHGSVTARSTPDVGTSFLVELPLLQPPSELSAEAEAPPPPKTPPASFTPQDTLH